VQLKIWPSSFHWEFGDTETLTTDHAGRPYEPGIPMSTYITHQYADAGIRVQPSVDTTYSAEYSLNGGRTWTTVDGSVTIAGRSSNLRVVEARPVLVGSD